MIKKQRQTPLIIPKLEVLLRRLPKHHLKRADIKKDLAKWVAGYKGEESLNFHLEQLNPLKYLILHDLRLPHGKYHFQIDTLLITSRYLLIVEVKNISGTLYFDKTTQQMIRTKNEQEDGFQDPITQAKKLRTKLKSFLAGFNIPELPIEYLIIISNSSTVLKFSDNHPELVTRITHAANLEDKITYLERNHQADILGQKTIQKLIRVLIKNHNPLQTDVMNLYSIEKSSILTGVYCSVCSFLPMKRITANWHCPNCGHKCNDAHIEALNDYSLLFGNVISNSQCRSFLHVETRFVAYQLLHNLGLSSTGSKKGTTYILPPPSC
ncbi:rubrerythrin [Peribacillus deserti]|uniref:Rubrerythrin n=1 Tax=Peribacillus deserti TaxID=673318 RepID=A0ABS2QIC9_9BACI|nr:nuclease-related domain-containing protein [Peribacillus deserti]MBM7692893.1 rubrerythrin [Peribacillus deserti]